MAENKVKLYSLLIKIGIGIVAGIFVIILAYQYITIGKLNSEYNSLKTQETALQTQYDDYESQKSEIESDYDSFVKDYARDEHNYTQEGEILINKK